MKKLQKWFDMLSKEEKIKILDKLMPNAGSFRLLEQNIFTENQYKMFLKEHTKSIKWEIQDLLSTVSVHSKQYSALGYDEKNREYSCVADVDLVGDVKEVSELEPTFN